MQERLHGVSKRTFVSEFGAALDKPVDYDKYQPSGSARHGDVNMLRGLDDAVSALRAAATRLARDVCEAAEFGLAASAVDVPRGPPGAPDGEGAPATGEATFWYDAARNEIRLLL